MPEFHYSEDADTMMLRLGANRQAYSDDEAERITRQCWALWYPDDNDT